MKTTPHLGTKNTRRHDPAVWLICAVAPRDGLTRLCDCGVWLVCSQLYSGGPRGENNKNAATTSDRIGNRATNDMTQAGASERLRLSCSLVVGRLLENASAVAVTATASSPVSRSPTTMCIAAIRGDDCQRRATCLCAAPD